MASQPQHWKVNQSRPRVCYIVNLWKIFCILRWCQANFPSLVTLPPSVVLLPQPPATGVKGLNQPAWLSCCERRSFLWKGHLYARGVTRKEGNGLQRPLGLTVCSLHVMLKSYFFNYEKDWSWFWHSQDKLGPRVLFCLDPERQVQPLGWVW